MKEKEASELLKEFMAGKGKIIVGVVVGILFFLVFLNPFVIIGAGERGVVLNFGSVQDIVMDEGLHLRIPFVQKIIIMDVQIQKSKTDAAASTKDLQDSHSTIVVNHQILPAKANYIYQHIGLDYRRKIIDPNIQEAVKAATAHYTAEQLITQRDKISIEIREALKKKLIKYHIIVDNLSIVNFSFSKQFTQAIEDKQTAEQRALKAQQDLKRIEIEAKQKVTLAKAEAESLRLQRAVISDQVIKLRQIEAKLKAIEKWDGHLPNVTAGAVPFLNLDNQKK